MHFSNNSATRVFKSFMLLLMLNLFQISTDGGLVGANGRSSDGVAAHGCGAGGGADRGADGRAEDRLRLLCDQTRY